jgi:EAL domain-containing protein (putative c-di-GMP-specific phosphodiesterase class I)
VDLATRTIAGAEALIRWNHRSLGRISPTLFVPILEDIRLIDEIGMWALNAACRTCRSWRESGRGDLTVAVNLSSLQLGNPALVRAVERTLQRHALPAAALVLELTETAAMQDEVRTLALFGELKALGVGLAIDDFGTGYSSLSYLLKLPFDKLKIDREFVVDVHRKRQSQAICRSLCELAKGLELALIAEGAETPGEVAMLGQLGCRFLQGFYFSPPVSDESFGSLLRDHSWIGRLIETSGGPDCRLEKSAA